MAGQTIIRIPGNSDIRVPGTKDATWAVSNFGSSFPALSSMESVTSTENGDTVITFRNRQGQKGLGLAA